MGFFRNIPWLPCAAFLVCCLQACEEVPPAIDLLGSTLADTTYISSSVETPQQKNVLMEEFTGVKCVNCPVGHDLIASLKNQYGSRLITVSAHSNFLASPYEGDPDLRNEDAEALEKLLGPLIAKPSAAIDRTLFAGESSLLVLTPKWASFVAQQMNQTTPVNLKIETTYLPSDRKLTITIILHYTKEETAPNKLMVMLIENNIVTQQLDHSGIIPDYVQNNVLRKILTSVNSLSITPEKLPGRVIVLSFGPLSVPDSWKATDLMVVAFVHREGASQQVLQVAQKSIL
ncbi:MAG: hypothetical protein KatS3mg031_2215 [Chitinophagales bacterium]|nr:MAG: hypothetical protein KatS3mg031_2215 [Chitinophagales bacterium]